MCMWMIEESAFKTRRKSSRWTERVLRFFSQQERNNLYIGYIFFEKHLTFSKLKKFLSVIFGLLIPS